MTETRAPIPHKIIGVAVIHNDQGEILIDRRRQDGLLVLAPRRVRADGRLPRTEGRRIRRSRSRLARPPLRKSRSARSVTRGDPSSATITNPATPFSTGFDLLCWTPAFTTPTDRFWTRSTSMGPFGKARWRRPVSPAATVTSRTVQHCAPAVMPCARDVTCLAPSIRPSTTTTRRIVQAPNVCPATCAAKPTWSSTRAAITAFAFRGRI